MKTFLLFLVIAALSLAVAALLFKKFRNHFRLPTRYRFPEVLKNHLEDDSSDYCSEEESLKDMLDNYFELERPFLLHDLSIRDVAAKLMTNRTTLTRMLHNEMHTNFREMINYYRVREAIRLLARNPELKMSDLCQMSGFRNMATFIKSFKIRTGKTPGVWCKQVKQNREIVCRNEKMVGKNVLDGNRTRRVER